MNWKLTKLEKEYLRSRPIILRPFIYLIGVLLLREGFPKVAAEKTKRYK